MNEILAKRYAKAIFSRKDSEEFFTHLCLLTEAFKLDKTRKILDSYELSSQKKLDFLLSLLQNPSNAFVNFLKVIAKNQRFNLIPFIMKELASQKAFKEQKFTAKIYSLKLLNDKEIAELKEKLVNKFKVDISLESIQSQDEGIRIDLDELGYEIAFSTKNLKSKMSEYILKTI